MTLRTERRLQLAMLAVALVLCLIVNWRQWQMRQTIAGMIAESEARMESRN